MADHGGTAPPDVSRIGEMGAELARIVTSPGYFDMVAEFRAADPEEQLGTVWDIATLDNVTARDVPVTETFRVAPRTFADPGVTDPLMSFRDGRGSVAFNGILITVTPRDTERGGP